MKIYAVRIANGCLSVLPQDTLEGLAVKASLNERSLLRDWRTPEFSFKAFRRSGKVKPDITMLGGGLAFREELMDRIFPSPCEKLEFLPIRVSQERWLVTNCMKAVSLYDNANSILYRTSDSGNIFLINHIIVQDPTIAACEIFVVADSNRSTLLAVPSFVERIGKLELRGIQFSEIGVLQCR